MSKRLKHEIVYGSKGEKLKISWMPDNRVRLDFVDCGKCVVTKIFPKKETHKKETHIEVSYNS